MGTLKERNSFLLLGKHALLCICMLGHFIALITRLKQVGYFIAIITHSLLCQGTSCGVCKTNSHICVRTLFCASYIIHGMSTLLVSEYIWMRLVWLRATSSLP